MMRHGMNPGTIHMRFARVQELIENAVAAGNLVVHANMLGRLRVYSSVYMSEAQMEEYDAMPGLDEDHRTAWQVCDDLNAKEEYLLNIVKDYGVFVKGDHAKGDASGLDDEEAELVTV